MASWITRHRKGMSWIASGAAMLVAAGAAWVAAQAGRVSWYNIKYSLHEIRMIRGDPTDEFAGIPEQFLPLMLDLSVVSPALVTFTATCMLIGSIVVIRPSLLPVTSRHFPFPGSYRGRFVQLGLLGTIVGFVIAFSSIKAGSSENPYSIEQSKIMLDALGPALWSTLTALVLAYVFGPLFEAFMQLLMRFRGAAIGTDSLSALERLRERGVQAAASLGELANKATALGAELDLQKLGLVMAEIQAAVRELSAQTTRLELDLKEADRRIGQLDAQRHELKTRVQELENARSRQQEILDAIDQAFRQ